MKMLIVVLAACGFMSATVHAEESTSEKVGSTMNDGKRGLQKGANRVKEAVCAEGDAKCLAKKGKHRVEEGGSYVKDKAKEGADKVDADGKSR